MLIFIVKIRDNPIRRTLDAKPKSDNLSKVHGMDLEKIMDHLLDPLATLLRLNKEDVDLEALGVRSIETFGDVARFMMRSAARHGGEQFDIP